MHRTLLRSQGQPSGEAFIQMDSEASAFAAKFAASSAKPKPPNPPSPKTKAAKKLAEDALPDPGEEIRRALEKEPAQKRAPDLLQKRMI